jgi:two-component system nitrate/nitrite response regulator NarL
MRVLIFSHIRLFGEALATLLKETENISQVISCYQADGLIETVSVSKPKIILLDLTMECVLNEAHEISDTFPDIPVLAIALPEYTEMVISCAEAGMAGYVPIHASLDELIVSIDRVLKGECGCHPKIAFDLLREIRKRKEHSNPSLAKPLTQREREILRLTGKGLSNKLIARELNLSVATIKNHQHNIFAKLQIHSRAEALAHLRNEPWLV